MTENDAGVVTRRARTSPLIAAAATARRPTRWWAAVVMSVVFYYVGFAVVYLVGKPWGSDADEGYAPFVWAGLAFGAIAGLLFVWVRFKEGRPVGRRVSWARDCCVSVSGPDPQDWNRPGVDAIVSNVLANAHPGAVNLMHDGGGDRSQSVAALAKILPALVQQGYSFAALPGC